MLPWRRLLCLLLTLLAVGWHVHHPAAALPLPQEAERLVPGETVTGTIDDAAFRRLYTFSGSEGQVVTLEMQRESGNLDPYLLLMTVAGEVITHSDDDNGMARAVIDRQWLPATGEYVVIATRFGHEHGLTGGEFSLVLESVSNSGVVSGGPSFAQRGNPDNLLNFGETAIGEISDEEWNTVYSFQGRRGQVVNIFMTRTSGELDSRIDLFDNSGQVLISGDDPPDSPLNARITNFRIRENGVYYVRATRYGWETGPSTGTYILRVEEVPPDELGTRPLTARYMNYGDVLTASIDDAVTVRFFEFEAQRGDFVSVTVQRETENIAPSVSIWNADLRPISTVSARSGGEEVRVPGISIPEDGLYYVVVSRFGGEAGTSVGSFSVALNGRAGLAVGDDMLEIIYDTEVNGIIDDNRVSESYMFLGEEGDVVTITLRSQEGDLDPLLTLFDETGKQLVHDDDGYAELAEGSKDALIQAYRLPRDGVYIIEASRYERVAGETSGVYGLRLELVKY